MSEAIPTPQKPLPPDMSVRRARPGDRPQIGQLLSDLELSYPAMDLSRFWVAAQGETVLAMAELKDLHGFSLLSCVGVREELQGRGLGRLLVETLARHAGQDIYLYTLIPAFFLKMGFTEVGQTPPNLPPRSIYGCANCDPSSCRCLVKKRDDS